MQIQHSYLPLLFLPSVLFSCSDTIPERMNVVFILTDDQGYGDFGWSGNKYIKTPNIDKLKNQSTTFTNFHVGTSSSPSRAKLLTGQNSVAVGIRSTTGGHSLLAEKAKLLPDLLYEAGYKTGMFGKWHLGDNYPYLPHNRGFEEAFYHGGGGVGQQPDYYDNTYFNDTYFRNGVPEKATGYCTDVWFKEALKFIDKNKQQAFFCYISLNAPHGPYNVPKKYYDQYADDENVPSAAFYGMISNIDENVGHLMERLEELELDEKTIIIYVTDNGTSCSFKKNQKGQLVGFNAGMRGQKGSPYEGGHRVPFIMRIPNRDVQEINHLVSGIDFLPTILAICGVKNLIPKDVQGTSLVPLILKDTIQDRVLFTHGGSCVMYKSWRLIKNKELYDVCKDPAQKKDVANDNPKIVKKLQDALEEWKGTIAKKRGIERIIVGNPQNMEVMLTSHDASGKGLPPWHQRFIRSGRKYVGKWALKSEQEGKYKLSLHRWHPDSKLAIGAKMPAKDLKKSEVGESFKEGVALDNIQSAEIVVNGIVAATQKIDITKEYVSFEVLLPKGDFSLETNFICKDKTKNSACYLIVEKIK